MPEKRGKGPAVVPGGEIILDFSKVRPFEPLDPRQKYLCRVTKLERGRGPQGPRSHLELTIEAPEEVQVEEWIPDEAAEGGMSKVGPKFDEKTGDPVMTKAKGRILFREFSLLTQALPFLYEFIKAVAPETKLDEKFRYLEKNYMGLPCTCSVTNEAFQEQIRARVKRMTPASAYKAPVTA